MKGLLKFMTCGSVDDGKSTLIGHILYDSKLLYTDQEQALRLDSKVGSRSGEIDYSLLLDGLMAEREQGITIDVAYRYFTTDKRSFIVADAPGHEEYTRNMAVGASFADLAVILVDASQGVLVQTRRHARICSLMGVRYFVFAVNKMDLVDFSQERFEEIGRQIEELTEELSLSNTTVIPLSATDGDNVTVLSERTPWYKGGTLLEYLEEVEISPENVGKGFYMPVQRVSRPDRTFRGSQGQIEAGSVSVGDEVRVLPSGETASVKTILAAGKETDTAFAGQPVTIVLDREVDVSRGCVIEKDSGLAPYRELSVSLLWMDDAPLSPGKEYLIKLGTKQIPGVLTKILYAVDINTGKHIPAESLSKNGIALCQIVLSEAVTADTFALHRTMGELILIDRVSHATSACGVVQALSGEAKTGNAASFVYGGVSARGDVFEEFFYDTETLSVFRYQPVTATYTVGDTIPVKGESYGYPDSFDVIVLRDRAAVLVRDRTVEAVIPLEEYQFTGLPLVNGRGFEILADTPESFRQFLTEYDDAGDRERPEFFRRWVRFDTYRKVVIR